MTKLKRSLGLVECTLMGVGVILGAGIYALIGQAAALAGNAVWLSFLGAAIVAALTGLSYAELSSFIPKAGGAYYYARRALGDFAAFLTTWLLLIGLAIASAAVALGFAGYANAVFDVELIWTAALLVAASMALLIYGIKQSAWVAGFCTLMEVLGLAAVIAIGLPQVGSVDYLKTAEGGVGGVLAASALIFFAYIGFEEIVQLAEETREPTRVIPRAVLLSITVSTVLYVLVAIAAVSVLGAEHLGKSRSPMADVAAASFGQPAFLALSVIALFSTANTVLILVMSSARLLYGMAEDGMVPRAIARIHGSRQTPYVATVVVAAVSVVILVSLESLGVVANLTNFTFLASFVIINTAVIVLRFRERETPRPFRVPGTIGRVPLIPLLGAGSSLFLIAQVELQTLLLGFTFAALGVPVYLLSRRNRDGQPNQKRPLDSPKSSVKNRFQN